MENKEAANEVEALIRDYIRYWSAKDAATVWSRFYRLNDESKLKTQADVQAILDDLAAQGFARSELHSVHVKDLAADRAVATIRYTRFKTDGSPMSLTDKGAEYHLRKFIDGWRIISVLATD